MLLKSKNIFLLALWFCTHTAHDPWKWYQSNVSLLHFTCSDPRLYTILVVRCSTTECVQTRMIHGMKTKSVNIKENPIRRSISVWFVKRPRSRIIYFKDAALALRSHYWDVCLWIGLLRLFDAWPAVQVAAATRWALVSQLNVYSEKRDMNLAFCVFSVFWFG